MTSSVSENEPSVTVILPWPEALHRDPVATSVETRLAGPGASGGVVRSTTATIKRLLRAPEDAGASPGRPGLRPGGAARTGASGPEGQAGSDNLRGRFPAAASCESSPLAGAPAPLARGSAPAKLPAACALPLSCRRGAASTAHPS